MNDDQLDAPEKIFEQIERDRASGVLRKKVCPNGGYGTSKLYPGYICKLDASGKIVSIGHYHEGEFIIEKVFD